MRRAYAASVLVLALSTASAEAIAQSAVLADQSRAISHQAAVPATAPADQSTVAGGASGLNQNSGIDPGGYQNCAFRFTARFKPRDTIHLTAKDYAGESRGGAEAIVATGSSKTSVVINYTNPNFLLDRLFGALAPMRQE
jgi:hypothetical protein